MERVQVEIYGQTYSMKGGGDADRIRGLAAYVDSKMKEIERGTGTVDPLRVAILAAITITDELQSVKERYGMLETTADAAADRLLAITGGER